MRGEGEAGSGTLRARAAQFSIPVWDSDGTLFYVLQGGACRTFREMNRRSADAHGSIVRGSLWRKASLENSPQLLMSVYCAVVGEFGLRPVRYRWQRLHRRSGAVLRSQVRLLPQSRIGHLTAMQRSPFAQAHGAQPGGHRADHCQIGRGAQCPTAATSRRLTVSDADQDGSGEVSFNEFYELVKTVTAPPHAGLTHLTLLRTHTTHTALRT